MGLHLSIAYCYARMELLRQCLRMTSYGERDHSGTVWAVRQGDDAGAAATPQVGSPNQRQIFGAAATAFKGVTPPRGAHVA
jgi:hypothetical protein